MTVYDQFRIQKALARRSGKDAKSVIIPSAYCTCGKQIAANKEQCFACASAKTEEVHEDSVCS